MVFSLTYIISQIFTIIMFVCLLKSYFSVNRKQIIIYNIFAQLCQSIASFLLNGLMGVAMSYVLLISDVILYIEHEKKIKKTRKRDNIVLIFLFIMVLYGAIISYNGFYSLLSLFGASFILIGVWQRDIRKYKVLGIIGSIFWFLYYIYIKSIVALFFQMVLIVCTIYSLKSKM